MTWTLDQIEYYLANMILVIILIKYGKEIVRVAKGGNGVLQKEEVNWLAAFFIACFYALRVMFLNVVADQNFLLFILAWLGIASHFSQKSKLPKPPNDISG